MPIRIAVGAKSLVVLAFSILVVANPGTCFSLEPGAAAPESRCGPSVCLKANGLEDPDAGQVVVGQTSDPGIKRKSPLVAGLLGGVVGFGSGQFYAKRTGSGVAFLILDGIFGAILIGGFAILDEADEVDHPFGVLGVAGASSLYIGAGSIGLITTHVIQAIWGPLAANRYNEELAQTKVTVAPFLSPTGNTVVSGLTLRF